MKISKIPMHSGLPARAGVLCLFFGLLFAGVAGAAPKYVFLFIGDGMGSNQVRLAGHLLADEGRELVMTSLPVSGLQGTSPIGGGVTDSAAAATALACGIKTSGGRLGMDATGEKSFKSLPRILKEQAGWRIGVITDVWVNHATPAGFYANVTTRSQYKTITEQLPATNFEFFAGGLPGLLKSGKDAVSRIEAEGYRVVEDAAGIKALMKNPVERVVCLHDMPYAVDQAAQDEVELTLADFVRVGLACLGTDAPFFMTVEAGKMDWCGHGNDAASMAHEVIALDDAVQVALDFAAKHPDETLIIVTADHETGGLGFEREDHTLADGGKALLGQRASYQVLKNQIWKPYQKRNRADFEKAPFTIATEPDREFAGIMKARVGLDYDDLAADELGVIESAFAKRMGGVVTPEHDTASMKYDKPKFVRKALLRVIAHRSGIDWQTDAHTGQDVPVYATGPGSEAFTGRYENTAIPRKILDAVGLQDIALPVILPNTSELSSHE